MEVNKNIFIDHMTLNVIAPEGALEFAAYLYKNGRILEKKMYIKSSGIIRFNYLFEDNKGVYYVKVFFKFNDFKSSLKTSHFFISKGEIKFLKCQILSEENNYLVEYYSQDSDILFITFNGTKSTKKTTPFGHTFIVNNGWDHIAVYQDNDTQYQDLSEDALFDIVSPYLKNKKIFTYGASLGGYCAVYYGGRLNATIIAASPKNSAHPSIQIKRFKELEFKHKNITNTPKTKNNVFIIYDPNIYQDTSFIKDQILPHYRCSITLAIPYGTHTVLKRIRDIGLLKELIFSIVKNDYFSTFNKIIVKNHTFDS